MGHPRFRPIRDTFISMALVGAMLVAGAGSAGKNQATVEKGTPAGSSMRGGGGTLVGLAGGHPVARHPVTGVAFGGVARAETGIAIRRSLLNLENGDAGCVVGVRLPAIVI